ncbi:MAG: small multi-drug export protein [Candidatus Altiarchaeales archaeon]|nr:small multi-drug export protein [Candidatus Altiarchaeota archaeon]MBU4267105.1 small multi-drug export protein [Candidatus Altiarchaeota archaeon]MBU4341906.1 small multi-drug export protein [Candidatus Altiarchaeota archaeon]MBU4406194.1 small multi-drug export protein [Candidatus Altiarchaeota archaeon]MCG2782952.1 small multi-drug export protein [Candidatus Altiarchaeales archaeon]
MDEILNIVWITFLPFLELRASIPYGILKANLNWALVFLVCVVTNIILGAVLYPLIDTIIRIFTRIGFIDNLYRRYVRRTQKRIDMYVKKYGYLGVAIFIGIPLPGSGVYSGALAAHLIGLDYKKFIIADIIGVLIAGIIVTIVSLTGVETFDFFIKII